MQKLNTKGNTSYSELLGMITHCLDEKKAVDITTIPLPATALADSIVIASGQSSRQVMAMADFLGRELKTLGVDFRVEGVPLGDWVLIDAGDVVVHLFRPEIREYYALEKMWGFEIENAHADHSRSH